MFAFNVLVLVRCDVDVTDPIRAEVFGAIAGATLFAFGVVALPRVRRGFALGVAVTVKKAASCGGACSCLRC